MLGSVLQTYVTGICLILLFIGFTCLFIQTIYISLGWALRTTLATRQALTYEEAFDDICSFIIIILRKHNLKRNCSVTVDPEKEVRLKGGLP